MNVVGSLVVPNHAEQVFSLELDGVSCRMRLWYQPQDFHWYASLEVPSGTPIVASRRLVNGSRVLLNRISVVSQDVRCDPIGEDTEAQPGRVPWLHTHNLNIVEGG